MATSHNSYYCTHKCSEILLLVYKVGLTVSSLTSTYIYIYGNEIAEQLQKNTLKVIVVASDEAKPQKNRKKMNAVTDHVSVMTHKE
jgi:hypothetical protein